MSTLLILQVVHYTIFTRAAARLCAVYAYSCIMQNNTEEALRYQALKALNFRPAAALQNQCVCWVASGAL